MLHLLKNALFIFIGILGIGILIGFHELGHFIFCKIFSISTPSFSIGMGPQLIKKKIGETTFSLSAIPLGGYVEIAGMSEVGQGEQKESGRKDKHSFASKPYYQKLLVLSGGIIFNLLFAYIIFIALFMFGIPKTPILFPEDVPAVIGSVQPGSAAEKYHLKMNDKITAINNQPINNVIELNKRLQELPSQNINLVVERDGQPVTLELVTDSRTANGKQVGVLGVSFHDTGASKELPAESFIDSIKHGISATNKCIHLTFVAFQSIFKQRTMDGLGGPLLVISETIKGIKKGVKIFLIMLAFISINLAILNLIPVPIMDGGQILFTTLEAIFRKEIPENIKLIIHYICWLGVIFLAVYLSIYDIKKIFFGK